MLPSLCCTTRFLLIYEPRREKTGLRGFRLGLTQTGLYSIRKRLEEEILCYPYSENKGADQLCSYCTADLRLCFRICKYQVGYFHDAAHIIFNVPLILAPEVKTCQSLIKTYVRIAKLQILHCFYWSNRLQFSRMHDCSFSCLSF